MHSLFQLRDLQLLSVLKKREVKECVFMFC